MNILVTGATGFLGFRLCQTLKEKGYCVFGAGRNEKKGELLLKEGISFLKFDLRNKNAVSKAVEGKDVVIHCGGLSSPWGKRKDFLDINDKGTYSIAQFSKEKGVKRFIFISSPSIYHTPNDRLNIKESDPLTTNPLTYYIESKIKAESSALKAFPESILLRPRAIYGPGDDAIFPRLIRAHHKGRLKKIGHGQNFTDLTYVDNVVEAILNCLTSDERSFGQAFNITDGQPQKLWFLLDHVFSKLGLKIQTGSVPYSLAYRMSFLNEAIHKWLLLNREPVLTRYTCNLLSKSQTLDITKAREVLGYKPKVTTLRGIDLFLKDYKDE
ncbi:NAD(P)-dependent oxidoreductase [Bacteriovoracales bacterium]|nr:NAD(P)-dependent oxidoreductase [Bacteriovoracales bacterium]